MLVVTLFAVVGSCLLDSGCATGAPSPADDETGDTPAADASSAANATARPDGRAPTAPVADAASKLDATTSAPTGTPPDSGVGVVPNPGEAFDPSAPKPGDTCPSGLPDFAAVSRRCGKCGSQRALCEAGRIIGPYGPCTGEAAGDSCLPNAVESGVECGRCGSRVRTCSPTCAWSTSVCLGEVLGGCVKDEVTYVEGVCTDIDLVRKQTCSATCAIGVPEPCARQNDTLSAPQVAGATASGTFALSTIRKIPRLTVGGCPTTSSTTLNTGFHYTRVVNPGSSSVNITATVVAPPSGTRPSVYVAAYLGALPPGTSAEREACADSVVSSTPSAMLNIPPGESAYILVNAAGSATTGRYQLDVKTNFTGAEPLAPVEGDITLDSAVGGTVSTPVAFVSTQTLQRRLAGTCPRYFSPSEASSPFRYYRLLNGTATARTVDIWMPGPLDTLLAVYPGPTPPLSQERGRCIGTLNTFCPVGAIAGADSCLTSVSVPALGSLIVYAATATASSGFATLNVRTTN
jgi:hypothetical protein